MPAIRLPIDIQEKLEDLAAEVRRLRLLRGVSWFAVLVCALPVVGVSLDVLFTLSGGTRGLMLAGGLAVAAFGFWRLVFRRIRGNIPPPELAAAIEQQYPNLAERLRTLVELSEHADAGNGSKAMIALLAKETDRRVKKMNFLKAAPTGFSIRLAAVSVLVGAAAVSPLFLFKGAAEHVRRLILPWYKPPVDVPYVVKVSSGNPAVKRGEAVTLAAYLERTKPTGELPTAATLVYRTPGGTDEKRLPMSGDDKAAFAVTRPSVSADFEYRVECGAAESDWFTVSAVDPVELADGSGVVVTAPEYAKGVVPEQKKDGISEIEALQHSTAVFTFRLSRVPADAHFEFRAAQGKADDGAANLNARLTYSGDRRTLTAEVPLAADGTLKLTLYGEKGVRTELPVAVKATPDAPPKFEKAVGVPSEIRDVTKEAKLTFDLAVTDDVAVGKAFVDFAPSDGPADRFDSEPLALPAGEKRAEGKAAFALGGRVKVGDTIRLRIRVQDNRSIPALGLTPNESTFPDKGWATLRVVEKARPLTEQDIVAQKDAIKEKLELAAKKVAEAARDVANLTGKTRGQASLSETQALAADIDRSQVEQAARLLNELARDADVQPELRPLANAARELAADQLAAAEDELRKAKTLTDAKALAESLAKTNKALAEALDRLQRLQKANEAGANSRLDRTKLEELAEDQKKLADEAATADPEKLKELEARQKELNDRLKELMKDSDALQKAAKDAERKRANELADDLKTLADKQRELDDATAKSADAARREQLDELKKLQKQLNDKAAKLAQRTDPSARLSDTKPLDPQPFDKANDLLDKKNSVDAMAEQEKAARELDRLADALAKGAAARGDAKAAAEQLARWQDDLRRRTADAAKQHPNGIPKAEKDKLAAEQKAIQKATERLALPKSDSLERLRTASASKAGEAAEKLTNKPAEADAAMKKAADALNELARQTPSNKQRREAAKAEVDKLRRDQEQIQKEAEDAARAVKKDPDDKQARDELAKKLAENAAKQDELAKKVKGLDTPGLEDRRDRTADAGRKASEDMAGGLPQDIPSSQADARRQLDRLGEALSGKTPADEKAAELAREQNEVSNNLSKAQKPEELQRLQRQQKEIAEQLSKLQAPEAPGQLADAQAAAKAAERAAGKPEPDVDELRKKSKEAAEALDKLADRMSGEEAAEKRLERLAKNRQAEADKANQTDGVRGDLSRSRDAQKQAERDLNDLNDTRTGAAQAAKKKLQDALDKLNRADEPDKAKELQQQAADAARKLADAVKKNGDRKGDDAKADKPNRDPADADDPGNALPTEKDAKAARALADKQRELRNDVAKAQERATKGEQQKPSGKDPLGDLAKEQADVAKKADELAKQAKGDGDEAAGAAADAAKKAQQAAEKMSAGDPADAKKAGAEAAQKLRDAAKASANPERKKQADDLAKKQDELNGQADQADNAAATERQRNRQGELAKEADQLADKLAKAAKEAEGNEKEAKKLDEAADAAKKAGRQMEQANRDTKNGKPSDAAKARRQAEQNLDDGARAARGDSKKPDGPPKPGDQGEKGEPGDKNAQAAADALKQADGQQKQAQGQMGKGESGAKPARDAAEKLKDAADQMAKAGEGQGEGGGQGGSGGNGGGGTGKSGDIPDVVLENLGKTWGDLPGDVKSKITAELKAKYGDDYARVIKLYFEQLAERK